MAESNGTYRVQYAALPYRLRQDGEVQLRLVTSRETRRWVIPKGWPMKGTPPHKAAAREAYEEAGLLGSISSTPIGIYRYDKRLSATRSVLCEVMVFPMKVKRYLKKWPERAQRVGFWFSIETAASVVQEPELASLILEFGAVMAERLAEKQAKAEAAARAKAEEDKPARAAPKKKAAPKKVVAPMRAAPDMTEGAPAEHGAEALLLISEATDASGEALKAGVADDATAFATPKAKPEAKRKPAGKSKPSPKAKSRPEAKSNPIADEPLPAVEPETSAGVPALAAKKVVSKKAPAKKALAKKEKGLSKAADLHHSTATTAPVADVKAGELAISSPTEMPASAHDAGKAAGKFRVPAKASARKKAPVKKKEAARKPENA